MRKILSSLLVISAIVAIVAVGARALFSDTEISTGNTFTTGTIDIAVNGDSPWSKDIPYTMEDMKPSYTDYIEFKVKNVGNNPANLWKTLEKFNTYDVTCVSAETNCNIHDIDNWINYDLRVELYNSDQATEPVWWQTIYMDSDNKKIGDLENVEMYLGMIPSGWTMKVTQSYHMVKETGNEYQADGMSFDIKLYAEQLTNSIDLENKDEVDGDLSHTLLGDDLTAKITYKVMDKEFSYSIKGKAKLGNTKYFLIEYKDPWGTPGRTLGSLVTNTDGTFDVVGSVDLNGDMINAKIWLVTDVDYNEGANLMSGWNPDNYLFETGLIDYYDSL